jgi:hypothetical protein
MSATPGRANVLMEGGVLNSALFAPFASFAV